LKSESSSQPIVDTRNDLEIPKYGFTYGINYVRKFKNKYFLKIGLLYSDKGYNTKNLILNSGQTISTEPIKEFNFYHFNYIDIPIKLNRRIWVTGNASMIYVSAGVSTNVFLSQKTNITSEYSDGHTATTIATNNNFNKINFSYVLGFGYMHWAAPWLPLTFTIEPTFRRSISSISNSTVKTYLYSVGLDVALYYRF
jgi:hypothetical protein